MESKGIIKIINKKIRRLEKEKEKSDGGDYYRNYKLVEIKIEVLEELKESIEKFEGGIDV